MTTIPEEWTMATRVLAPIVMKDAGTLLPGFGGVLDRIDSLLVTSPISYYAIVITQHFRFTPVGDNQEWPGYAIEPLTIARCYV